MRDNRQYWRYTLAVLSVLAIGIAIRLLPLHWTPLPFNPDGFVFANIARDSLAAGQVPSPSDHAEMQSSRYVFVLLLAIASQLTGIEPIWLAQPIIAIIGTVPALIAIVLVRKFGIEFGWSPTRILVAGTLAGMVLATEGLYLRRTVSVSYEVLGLLFIPLVALCVHRFFESSNWSWLGAAGVMLLALPATHHISTMIAAVTLTVLVAIWIMQRPTRLTLTTGVIVLFGFWIYLLSYYAQSPPQNSGVITSNPTLLIAWIIVIISLAYWVRTVSPILSRGTIACVNLFGFGILALNAIQPVFPGLSTTPPLLLALVSPLLLLILLASWGVPLVVKSNQGLLIIALLVAPLTFIGLGLTAGLSPQYDILVRRTQTFVHFGAVVAAVIAAFVLCDRAENWSQPFSTAIKVGLPIVLIFVAISTIPIAFIGLEALSYQGTTTEAEFATATFASETIPEPWVGDDHITRVEGNYYGSEHNAGSQSVYDWFHGGNPPTCTTVAEDSWTTVGAQFYPAPPEQLTDEQYADWQETNNLVYVTGSNSDRLVIVTPPGGSTGDC